MLFASRAYRWMPTIREITKHADKLMLMQELGQGASAHTGVVALKPPPTMVQIRDAIRRS